MSKDKQFFQNELHDVQTKIAEIEDQLENGNLPLEEKRKLTYRLESLRDQESQLEDELG